MLLTCSANRSNSAPCGPDLIDVQVSSKKSPGVRISRRKPLSLSSPKQDAGGLLGQADAKQVGNIGVYSLRALRPRRQSLAEICRADRIALSRGNYGPCMAIQSWLLPLTLLVSLAPRCPGQEPGSREVLQQQLAHIQELGNSAPSQLFFKLTASGSLESFATLKDALKAVDHTIPTAAAYGAFALYKGSVFESSVSNYLTRQAFKGPNSVHQLGATRALTYYWQSARTDLLRILHQHPAANCRQAALAPLLPHLLAEGGRANCLLVLKNSTGTGRDRISLTAALTRMTSTEAEACMASYLRNKDAPREVKILLLDELGSRKTEVARVAIERRLEDKDETVRLRALKWIAKEADQDQLRKLRHVVSEGSTDFVVKAMLILASSHAGNPEWVGELYGFAKSQNHAVRMGAAKALGLIPTRAALDLLHKLLKDRDLDVRLVAVEQVQQHHQLESIPKLIAELGTPRDLFTHELCRALRLMTGMDHGVSQVRWQAWFDDAGSNLQLPTQEEGRKLEGERVARRTGANGGTSASFYGLPVDSTRLCFVIDTSGSMSSPASGRGTTSTPGWTTRMEVAKLELKNTLNQLLNGVRFNIITFATEVTSYKSELERLTPTTRNKALIRVKKIFPSGGTAIYDALKQALRDKDIDTVYLLTDGTPTEGEFTSEEAILSNIGELTQGRAIRIHGVAIGQRSSLLRRLAANHGGQYTEIL
jgi:uncharacterized protein YegL